MDLARKWGRAHESEGKAAVAALLEERGAKTRKQLKESAQVKGPRGFDFARGVEL